MNDRPQITLWCILLATVVWSCCMQIETRGYSQGQNGRPLSCTYFSGAPIVDVELAQTPTCFQKILESDTNKAKENAKIVRMNTRMDFVFIALYWAVFILLARGYSGWWSKAVMISISASALFDCLENYRILTGVREYLKNSLIEGSTPRAFSMVKWVMLAIALLCLGKLFWDAVDVGSRIQATVLFVAGLLTIPGVFFPYLLRPAVYAFVAVLAVALVRYSPFSWETVVDAIEYAYLLRFQIVAGLILAVGLPAAYYVVPSIFQGLFDGRGFWSFSFIVWSAFQLAWTVMVTCRLVLVYGPERFGRAKQTNIGRVGFRTVAAYGLLAVPPIFILCKQTNLDHPWAEILGVALGLGMAVLVLMATAAMHFAIEPEEETSANAVFPSFGFLSNKISGLPTPRFWSFAKKCLVRLPPDFTSGIVKDGRIHSGHEMATIALLIFMGLYLLAGYGYRPSRVSPEQQPAALFFLFFLLAVLTWLFSGAAFFLDRFRLPVFATLLATSLLTGTIGTDHEFEIKPAAPAEPLPASTVIEKWIKGERRKGSHTIVVVATAGGGIRAAAWTTEVLTKLQEDCGEKLSSSILLMSSVSGGSVGTMFAVAPYLSAHGSFPDDEEHLKNIRFNAGRSSLSAVGWGLLYPDFARTIPFVGSLFIPKSFDRGWSLQNGWATGWRETKSLEPTMVDWRKDVANGVRPAVIFNATTAESGQPFLIASTDLSDKTAVQFFQEFQTWDIPVATSARLSATFPYVSPQARPSEGPAEKRYHLADGGYFDNSGVFSAIQWLEDALPSVAVDKDKEQSGDPNPYEVLLIIIDAEPGTPNQGTAWSWQRQSVGPIETLLQVRSSSQSSRDKFELKTEINYLRSKGMRIADAVTFLYEPEPDLVAPLSWHLTETQENSVHKNWPKQDVPRRAVYTQLSCEKGLRKLNSGTP